MNLFEVNKDAWSQGQICSKLWLIEELEKTFIGKPEPIIWILGSWYGLLPFLIFSRGRLNPQHICCFDIDPQANKIARMINNAWTLQPAQFFEFEADVVSLEYFHPVYRGRPDVVINTSCEHFSFDWLQRVPWGTFVVVQSTDMPHEQHVNGVGSLTELKGKISDEIEIFYQGQKQFAYPNMSFNRFMIMGTKK